MAVHKIRRGLDLPILGSPEPRVEVGNQVTRVAVIAADYEGTKPTMHVTVGDSVSRGQLLFEDKKTEGLRFTSPGAGKVVGIHRGDRRALISVVLELDAMDRSGRGSSVRFAAYRDKHPSALSKDEVRELLLESGQWVALRSRPYGRVANPSLAPRSIFVRAMDTNPLAPAVDKVMEARDDDFTAGLAALGRLTEGPVWVCTDSDFTPPMPKDGDFRLERFAGPHPSGTSGVHIHTLDPASRNRQVWYTNYQEVLAIGKLFTSGELDLERVISLAGPMVQRPRLLKVRLGTSTDEVVGGELEAGDVRLISGSPVFGRQAQGDEAGFLGRYDHQLTVLEEGRAREFLGWLSPGAKKFSVVNTFISKLMPGRKFAFNTSTNGSDRAIVPIGMYERVFPLDIPVPFLMRALSMRDIERAEQLGVLELTEEDVALCSYVCPGKHNYGQYLREVLTTLEKEG